MQLDGYWYRLLIRRKDIEKRKYETISDNHDSYVVRFDININSTERGMATGDREENLHNFISDTKMEWEEHRLATVWDQKSI